MSAEPLRCGVVGDPIAHSLSPALHNAGYAALALTASYDARRVAAGRLAAHVAGLGADWRGLSVTAPLKREALDLATTATDRALLAGGANTLVRGTGSGGAWHADNTDLPGAVAAIRERYAGPVTAGVVLGGGATAASTALALAELGARRIRVAVRDADRAEETVAAIRRHPSDVDVAAVELAGYRPAREEVVVSTVPAAAQSADLVARFASVPVLFEAVYDPWPTPLAAAHPGPVVTGLDLLVHQAVLQFEMFTGRPGPLPAMRAAGETALRERSADPARR
ncbi:shikimate dehydrogenase [Nocardioides sambongensis]|uniref:shikimate dehydrogenase n=1 Tax=Nocardioides sambongensis TaxID=2589074 RepID=UPI001126DE1A|nr:shikimate dehydrogenase [Nocardioides sambongensis]